MGLSPKASKILKYMQSQGKKDKLEIRLIFGKMATYNGDVVSSGFFDNPEMNNDLKSPFIVIGIDKKESAWLEILLHEFCHYLQWKRKTNVWNKYTKKYKKYDGGKETKKMLKSVVSMESECEKMTITLAKKLKYNLSAKSYAKKANAYLVFYQIYKDKKKWYKKPPFEQKSIISQMPDTIIKDPLKFKLSPQLRDLFLKCL